MFFPFFLFHWFALLLIVLVQRKKSQKLKSTSQEINDTSHHRRNISVYRLH